MVRSLLFGLIVIVFGVGMAVADNYPWPITSPSSVPTGVPFSLGGVVTGLSTSNVFNSTNTAGNTMNNAFIINNLNGYNNGIDLDFTYDSTAAGNIVRFRPDNRGSAAAFLAQGYSVAGGSILFQVSSDNLSNPIGIRCDSSDASGTGSPTPGYCGINNGLGFQSSFFVYETVYSAAGTPIPAAAASNAHGRACVSDSTACTSGTTYTSGGSTACELWSNGTNWKESGSGC